MGTKVALIALAALAPAMASGRVAGQDTIPAPPTFVLAGQIVDALTETPVISAVIKVPELRRCVFSDVNGRFAFPDFPEGTWEIVVEMLGYHTLDGPVTVAAGNGLLLRLNPDPIALEGLRVRTRADGLLAERRLRIPYKVTTLSAAVFANSINPDPTAVFRRNSRSFIVPCPETEEDPDEQMAPGCFITRGRPAKIVVYLDEGRLPEGMVQLTMLDQRDIHAMEWIPEMGELRVYTRRFIEKLNSSQISLSPLVYP